jgi:aminoglycoside 3-N-acetyltransferase
MSTAALSTTPMLVEALAGLGVGAGDTVVAHVSLSSIGWVAGGVQALADAFARLLGPGGTLTVPTFTPVLNHPSTWTRTRVAAANLDAVAAAMPAFDPLTTPPSRRMGVLADYVRACPGAYRSTHPHTSFAAVGADAAALVAHHPLSYRFGWHSPLGVLYDRDATALMIGVGWDKCTALHLAEFEADYPGRRVGLWPVPVGAGKWARVEELLFWEGDFAAAGAAFTLAHPGDVHTGRVGQAAAIAIPVRRAVDFAVDWMGRHRDLRGYVDPPGYDDVCDISPPPRPTLGE